MAQRGAVSHLQCLTALPWQQPAQGILGGSPLRTQNGRPDKHDSWVHHAPASTTALSVSLRSQDLCTVQMLKCVTVSTFRKRTISAVKICLEESTAAAPPLPSSVGGISEASPAHIDHNIQTRPGSSGQDQAGQDGTGQDGTGQDRTAHGTARQRFVRTQGIVVGGREVDKRVRLPTSATHKHSARFVSTGTCVLCEDSPP